MKHVEISTTGTVVTVRSAPYPSADNPRTIEAPDEVECGWTKVGDNWIEPLESIAARGRKAWPTAAAFLNEFSLQERAAVELSANPTIAALRLTLSTWHADVWSDDPRIQLGLATMEAEGIITPERKATILAK